MQVSSDTEDQEVLKRVLRAIELATKHHKFALYFVQSQLLTDQDNYLNYLKEQCNEMGVELLRVDLSRKIIKNPREVILNELNEKFPNGKPDKLTIAVTGLEASILADANEESPAVLQILNMGREHYARDLPYPSMFWLPSYAITKIASVAPDFWAWRGVGVNELVSSEEAKRQAINDAFRLHEPTNWNEGLYQINLFARLILGHPGSENGTDEQKREYRNLQYRLGAAYHSLEKYPRAYQHYRRAQEIGKLLTDFAQQGKELNSLGLVCRAMGELQKSLKYFMEYRAITEKRGDTEGLGVALGHIGLLYRDMQQNETAIEYFKHAQTINKEIRNRSGESDNLGNLGLAYQELGNIEKAIKYHLEALKVSKQIEDLKRVIQDLSNLGIAFDSQGKTKDAIGCFQQALELSRKSKDRPNERDLFIKIARCFWELGELEKAQDYYTGAEDTCQEMGDDRNLCEVLIHLAELSHEFEETKKEIDLYERALDLSRNLRDDETKLHCLRMLIQLHHRQRDPDKAKKYIDNVYKLLGSDLKLKKINVWLKNGSNRQQGSLAINSEYYLCLNIGEPVFGNFPLCQTDFIFNLVSEREDLNKKLIGTGKTSRVSEEEQKQISPPTPETYGVEEKPINVTETSRSTTLSYIDESQPTDLTPDQQPRQESSGLFHEEFSKEMVEVSVHLQDSKAFMFDTNEKRLFVSWAKDSETIYFRITPQKIGKDCITIEGAANDIPFDDLTINIEVKEAVLTEDNIIYIGNKAVMAYVLAVVTQFNTGIDEVLLMARGRAISRAVDTAEVVRNKFMQDVEIKDLKIGTEHMEGKEGNIANVSSIEITMKVKA